MSTVPVLSELDEATPELADMMERMVAKFPTLRTGGVWNRRYIGGTTTWSQHAWGNAIDLYDPQGGHDKAYLDAVAAWLKAQPETRIVLWQVRAHYDHIHYEPNPKRTGTPPLTPGGADGGNEVTTEQLQEMLNERGADPQLSPDGVYGPKTKAAWVAAGVPGPKGDKGDKGFPGDDSVVRGPKGDKGDPGDYVVRVEGTIE